MPGTNVVSGQGSGPDINLDEYLRELQIANASSGAGEHPRRDLAGLGIMRDGFLQPGSGYGE